MRFFDIYLQFSIMALCIAAQPTALVYRSAAICEGCPEAIAELLETSPSNFSVLFVGPDEEFQLSRETLQKGKVFAIGGGPGPSECAA